MGGELLGDRGERIVRGFAVAISSPRGDSEAGSHWLCGTHLRCSSLSVGGGISREEYQGFRSLSDGASAIPLSSSAVFVDGPAFFDVLDDLIEATMLDCSEVQPLPSRDAAAATHLLQILEEVDMPVRPRQRRPQLCIDGVWHRAR